MRKILLIPFILVLFGINISFGDAGSTTVSWNNNNVSCPSETRHGVVHKGIPQTNNGNVSSNSSATCITHTYYASSDSNVSFSSHNGINACPSGQMVISISPNPCNSGTCTMTCRDYDDIAPSASDVSSSISSTDYLNANSSKSITISVLDNGGSPITKINTDFEKESDKNNFYTKNGTSSPFTTTYNISNIDLDRNLNNYRDYTHKITKVCDEAGNCTDNIKTFTYHVYANNIDESKSSITGTSNFTGGDEVADGTEKTLTINLKDAYNNKIVPVYKSNNTLLRKIYLTGTYDNSLYSNQLNNSGIGVQLTGFDTTSYNNSSIGNNKTVSTTITDKTNNDGSYYLKFKVYAPTINGNNFKLTSFKGKVSDTNVETTLNSAVDFDFKPIFTTEITGDLAPSGSGFIEGNTQTGQLVVTKNGNSNPSIDGLYFVQSGTTLNSFTGTALLNDTGTGTMTNIEASTSSIGTKFLSSLSNGLTKILKTLFTLKDNGATLDELTDLRLYQYIKYTIGGKTVTYLDNILNQNNDQNFETLKIYGRSNISDKKQKDLLVNQDELDIQNLAGNITKASLKRDIKKRAINTIKFVDTANITQPVKTIDISNDKWDTNNGGKILGDILYYNITDGSNVIIGDGSELSVLGRKTLIVIGGNIRITQNIINTNKTDILGIIVLKDDNGNGGKVYIDSSVDEVDAVIYADKSIIGYDEVYDNGDTDNIIKHEVDGNINTNALDNQLYIYGSVFSENTIGASRIDPPVCPFWTTIQGITCDTIEAQKYDFNYLRSGLGTNPKYTGDPSTGKNYPVVIKYNPAVQTTPPPLFEEK